MTTRFLSRVADAGAALADMFSGSFGDGRVLEGRVVKGTVTAIENDLAIIDIGLKSEGRVPLREFAAPGQKADVSIGDEVEVYVDRIESRQGEIVLSRDRARREAAWDKLEAEHNAGNRVEGVIFGRVKGGFTVDLGGAVAFLPGSQVDIRPVRDVGPLMDLPQPFQILKMDRRRGNIVVSRRAILEETRAEQRSGLIMSLAEGQIVDGVVKNITDYGAFVDLGGIDGLLHVTDISYKRVGHPSEVINIGDTVKVQIIRINRDTQRISLGMKQLERPRTEPSQISEAFVQESAQALVDSVKEPRKLYGLLAGLASWGESGPPVWQGALRALYREDERLAADQLALVIHQVLMKTGQGERVPELLLAQATAYDRLGDGTARDLFAIEAAAGFMELEDRPGAERALILVRG